jgi:HPt (histidine-containing phosphotransfer) domain-containing protein
MNLNEAVDFETFYFHNLLETIVKKSENIFDESLQQSLQNFMDFLSSELSPLESIEKLAQLQGTSDLSIFFADLIERIHGVPPDEAMQNIDSYANDFLEIYRELAKDQTWQNTIYQELIGTDVSQEPEFTSEEKSSADTFISDAPDGIDFQTFIHTELKERVLAGLGSKDSPAISEVEPLFNYLETIDLSTNPFEKYQDVHSLMPLSNLFKKLMENLTSQNQLENYIEEFDHHIEQLCETIDHLYKNNLSDLQAFSRGDLPAIELEISEEETVSEKFHEMEVMETSEDLKISDMELTEEDKNLRWLLRDYITHEIEELTKEISAQFQKLMAKSPNEEAQSIILDNIKVLKDLGQIHKYTQIESASLEISKILKPVFASGSAIPLPAVDLVENIFSDFNKYIDEVLQNRDQNLVESINNSLQKLSGMFVPSSTVEQEISFEMRTDIEAVFNEVNKRYVRRLEFNFNDIVKNPDDDSLKEMMINDLSHLRYWYNLLGLKGAENLLEVFVNWLQNSEKREKLVQKYAEVGNSLRALSDKLFNTSFDEWTGYLEKLTISGKEPVPVDVNKALKAFVEVAHRQLEKAVNTLHDENADVSLVIKNQFIPLFKQFEENSLLIKNQSLTDFCNHSLDIFQSLSGEGPDKFDLIRSRLSSSIQELAAGIEKMPLPLPLPHIKDQLNTLLKDLRESGKQHKTNTSMQSAAHEESFEEVEKLEESEDFNVAFEDETRKFLEELDSSIAQLNENLSNKKEISKIGDALHSINSSAQMLKRPDIADLAGALENLTEMVQNDKVRILKQYVSLCRRVSKGIDKLLGNKRVDTKKIVNSIENYLKKYIIDSDSLESAKKKSGISESKTTLVESSPPQKAEDITDTKDSTDIPVADKSPTEPLLKLTEEDPELIEIFKNEAKDNLDNIDTNLNLIEKFRYDKQTLQVLDHSIHEIRSAAKMLGFD